MFMVASIPLVAVIQELQTVPHPSLWLTTVEFVFSEEPIPSTKVVALNLSKKE